MPILCPLTNFVAHVTVAGLRLDDACVVGHFDDDGGRGCRAAAMVVDGGDPATKMGESSEANKTRGVLAGDVSMCRRMWLMSGWCWLAPLALPGTALAQLVNQPPELFCEAVGGYSAPDNVCSHGGTNGGGGYGTPGWSSYLEETLRVPPQNHEARFPLQFHVADFDSGNGIVPMTITVYCNEQCNLGFIDTNGLIQTAPTPDGEGADSTLKCDTHSS